MLPSYSNLLSRLIISIYGISFAFMMPLVCGIESSYSMYHLHEPIILGASLTLLSISLFLHKNRSWTLPSVALICVAIFSINYNLIHNIAAFTFFLSSSWAMFLDDRYKRIGYFSFIFYSLLLVPDNGIFWFEFIQIIIISTYHTNYAYKMIQLKRKRI